MPLSAISRYRPAPKGKMQPIAKGVLSPLSEDASTAFDPGSIEHQPAQNYGAEAASLKTIGPQLVTQPKETGKRRFPAMPPPGLKHHFAGDTITDPEISVVGDDGPEIVEPVSGDADVESPSQDNVTTGPLPLSPLEESRQKAKRKNLSFLASPEPEPGPSAAPLEPPQIPATGAPPAIPVAIPAPAQDLGTKPLTPAQAAAAKANATLQEKGKGVQKTLGEKPAPAPNNWAQRLGLAALSLTRFAPIANQLVHPKWSDQERAYESRLAGAQGEYEQAQEEQKAANVAANTEALVEQREGVAATNQERAERLRQQANPHFGMQQVDSDYAQENLPWLKPETNGQYWVDKTIANTLTKPDKDKPFAIPPGSSLVDSSGKVLYIAPAKPETPTGDFEKTWLPKFASELNKTPDQLTKAELAQANKEYAAAKETPDTVANRELSGALKRLQIGQQPTPEQAANIAQDLINHRMAPEQMAQLVGGFGAAGGAFKRMVIDEAHKINPNFNYEEAAAEYALGKSPQFQQTVRYMDYVDKSIGNLIRDADALGNGGVRSINELVNAGKNQFNNVNLGKFRTARLELADAVAKILQGGGTGSGTSDAKLKQASDLLADSDDPALIRAKTQEIKDLIGNRRSTLTKGTWMERTANTSELTHEEGLNYLRAAGWTGGKPTNAEKAAAEAAAKKDGRTFPQ